MPAFFHPDYAAGGPEMVRTRAGTAGRIRLRVLGSYSSGANYSAVSAATIGFTTLAASDITVSVATAPPYEHTLASKTVTLTSGDDGAGMHWAITDETDSKVLLVAPGTPNETPLESGGVLTSPSGFFSRHSLA